jgi:hypothetical protein
MTLQVHNTWVMQEIQNVLHLMNQNENNYKLFNCNMHFVFHEILSYCFGP